MYATDFEYADKRLSDFNCTTCYIDRSAGVEEMNIGCDISFNTIKNNHSSIHSKTSSSYDNVYTTTFQIMKKDYQNEEEKYYDVHYYGMEKIQNNIYEFENSRTALQFFLYKYISQLYSYFRKIEFCQIPCFTRGSRTFTNFLSYERWHCCKTQSDN